MQENIPRHVGIIMDGNRRWARRRGLPTLKGHQKGYDNLKKIALYFFERGVKIVSFYAFSTENWKRSEREVSYLIRLLKKAFTKDLDEFNRKNIRLRISGRRRGLSKDLKETIREAEKATEKNTGGIVNICFNYGGRPEIVDAVRDIIRKGVLYSKITEELISENLYTAGLPDPDLIIRTSGEQRLSGFLLWECSYSELLFVNKHWPDFGKEDADGAIREYFKRNRRFGGS